MFAEENSDKMELNFQKIVFWVLINNQPKHHKRQNDIAIKIITLQLGFSWK